MEKIHLDKIFYSIKKKLLFTVRDEWKGILCKRYVADDTWGKYIELM